MITQEFKQRILEAISKNASQFSSQNKQAIALGINSAQLSRIKNGELDGVLSDANWITLARRLNVSPNEKTEWKTAKTEVFSFVFAQLSICQAHSVSGMLCDLPDIGKTYTAKIYCSEHQNAVYIDCSQVKTKQKLIRKIAQEFGVAHTGKYAEVYEDLVFFLNGTSTPMIVLDEFGDLDYPAFLECKALWNATEYQCGFYAMGADGLRDKITRNKNNNKVGFAEMFRRLGDKFQHITPVGSELESFKFQQTALVAKANGLDDVKKVFAQTGGSLSRVRLEVLKQKLSA